MSSVFFKSLQTRTNGMNVKYFHLKNSDLELWQSLVKHFCSGKMTYDAQAIMRDWENKQYNETLPRHGK